MKKYLLLVALCILSMVTQAQSLLLTSDEMYVYKGDSLEYVYEVGTTFYMNQEEVTIELDGTGKTYRILDIHYNEDETEMHFAIKADDGNYTQEVIYSKEYNAIMMVDYTTSIKVIFPNITTTLLEGKQL